MQRSASRRNGEALCAAAAAITAATGVVQAGVLWDQAPDPNNQATDVVIDQEFPDYVTYSTYVVNDVVTDAGGWNVTSVTTFYTMRGTWDPGITTGRLNIFEKTGALPGPADDGAAGSVVDLSWSIGPDGESWAVTASGLNIALAGNTEYWIGLTPIASFAAFQKEYHLSSQIVVGAQTAVRNPGGGWGIGTHWQSATDGIWDSAFVVEGTVVPAPASLALLGLGAAGGLMRRRGSRRSCVVR